MALGARTNIEIDIMNTKYADGYRIVSEDEQALAFLADWIGFCQDAGGAATASRRGPTTGTGSASAHLLDQDENGSRYTLLDGVHLVWKRCHTWGNVIGGHDRCARGRRVDTYCPAPHDQFVVQWNGDVVSCCTDYEGLTKTANVFASSVEDVWRGETRRDRLQRHARGAPARRVRALPGAQVGPMRR